MVWSPLTRFHLTKIIAQLDNYYLIDAILLYTGRTRSDINVAKWQALPSHFSMVMGDWVVMPNHFHAIIILQDGDCPGFGGVSVITLTPPNPGTFHDKFQLALISEGIDVKTVY